ncbi:hypothetical protein ECANGB1_908 [Enterospora canceri]|uniref:Uncharacterized protein n=1 Tax=Enterospora canceri TaxID=1081671 RepID=A0A1Y1S7B7_9MICR|nr:hypothetical protein ECANGB1_908 [Enterospora canceri]
MDFVTVERAELPVKGMAICSAWSEKNLALITSENKCHAFFKNHFLFDFSASNATALDASSKFIVLGTNTGTIIQYDPVLKARNANNKHSKSVTAVHCYQDTVLSASEDGSYSLGNNKVDVTPSGIVDALLMPDGSVVCACGDNSVVVSKNNAFTTYLGHKDKIINLSHNKSTITSSVDGFFGILRNELNMVNMECSKHEQRNSSLVLGYGMTKLRHFDLNSGKIIDLYEENNTILNKPQINCATVEGDLIAFTTGNGSTINFLDPRSDDKMCYEIGQPIIDLKFSNTSDLLYVATETSSIMCNVKRITM